MTNGSGCGSGRPNLRIRIRMQNTGTFTSFFKDKSHNTVENHGFSYYFCLMMEGSGSVLVTNGWEVQKIRILQIRMQIRIPQH